MEKKTDIKMHSGETENKRSDFSYQMQAVDGRNSSKLPLVRRRLQIKSNWIDAGKKDMNGK
jgi:hypothetical protein